MQRQIFSVCTSPVVQDAWHKGQPLAVHGLIYSVEDGLLKVRVSLLFLGFPGLEFLPIVVYI